MTKTMKVVLIVLLAVVLAVGGLAWYVIGSMRADAVQTVEKPDLESVEEGDPELQEITVVSDDPQHPACRHRFEERNRSRKRRGTIRFHDTRLAQQGQRDDHTRFVHA
jgi:hypothetical protein